MRGASLLQRFGDGLNALDSRSAAEAALRATQARRDGMARVMRNLRGAPKSMAAEEIATQMGVSQRARDQLKAQMSSPSGARAAIHDYARFMDRGPLGMEAGPVEAINQLIANSAMARQVGLGAAAAGTGLLATGVALPAVTSFGQGLMQLAGFMQQGQQTAQAREESPLLSG